MVDRIEVIEIIFTSPKKKKEKKIYNIDLNQSSFNSTNLRKLKISISSAYFCCS